MFFRTVVSGWFRLIDLRKREIAVIGTAHPSSHGSKQPGL